MRVFHVLAMLVFVASLILGGGEAYATTWPATAAHEIDLSAPVALRTVKAEMAAVPNECHDVGCLGLVTLAEADDIRVDCRLRAPVMRECDPSSPLFGRDPPVPRLLL